MNGKRANKFFFITATCAVTSIFKKRGAHVLTLRCGNPPLLQFLSISFLSFFLLTFFFLIYKFLKVKQKLRLPTQNTDTKMENTGNGFSESHHTTKLDEAMIWCNYRFFTLFEETTAYKKNSGNLFSFSSNKLEWEDGWLSIMTLSDAFLKRNNIE